MDISILYRYTCVYNYKSYWHIWEKRKYLPNSKYRSGHWWERINMVVKCIVHMYLTAELKPTASRYLCQYLSQNLAFGWKLLTYFLYFVTILCPLISEVTYIICHNVLISRQGVSYVVYVHTVHYVSVVTSCETLKIGKFPKSSCSMDAFYYLRQWSIHHLFYWLQLLRKEYVCVMGMNIIMLYNLIWTPYVFLFKLSHRLSLL